MLLVSILILALGYALKQSDKYVAFGYLFLLVGGVLLVLSAFCFFSPNLRNTNGEQLNNLVASARKKKFPRKLLKE